ncbi:MAG: nucleotidyltransferase substrate binding protein [Bdellovibrionales bacterium]|nr:nucleotidyltransferase substrate binding protein [Bdellovibrionales bacterium]
MAAVIQAFEFTFEQCWKAIQKKAGQEGVTVASPKKALEWAMSAGWLPPVEEPIWLEMLDDQNLTSHTYREPIAKAVATRIQDRYRKQFEKFSGRCKAPDSSPYPFTINRAV